MVKKKINKKRVNSYNRNILVGIFIIVLLFIFAYYFGEYDGRDGEGLGSGGMFDFFDGTSDDYDDYTEVLEGDEGDEEEGSEESYMGDEDEEIKTSGVVDILKNNDYLCYLSDQCMDDEANSITGYSFKENKALKLFKDIKKFRELCPISKVRFRTTPLNNAFDCSDYALAAQLCAAFLGYGPVYQLVEPATKSYDHALNIIEVELNEEDNGKDMHRFCTIDQSYDWFTNNEGWNVFPSCCWNQKDETPKIGLSRRCLKTNSKIYSEFRRTMGLLDPCFLNNAELCEELSKMTGIPLQCIERWKKL